MDITLVEFECAYPYPLTRLVTWVEGLIGDRSSDESGEERKDSSEPRDVVLQLERTLAAQTVISA